MNEMETKNYKESTKQELDLGNDKQDRPLAKLTNWNREGD